MNKRFLFMALFLVLMTGCSSKHMQPVSMSDQAITEDKSKAVVIFMRPSSFAGAIQSSVFNVSTPKNEFVGIVSTDTKIAYQTTPGKKLFMVVGEAADFMGAELEAGKTYYALVTPRVGWWKARFSLKPIHRGELNSEDFIKWKSECQFVKPLPSAHLWARENAANIQTKRVEYYQDWMQKPASERPQLSADDGI